LREQKLCAAETECEKANGTIVRGGIEPANRPLSLLVALEQDQK
jgi:hypothetical protein